ncbi:outer membrane autotransporter barrel domain protein [Anaerovibrio sp. JC8]|nr:outer membrane autotransporter barrel domain protein [Anaerovibrio sp. JC8]
MSMNNVTLWAYDYGGHRGDNHHSGNELHLGGTKNGQTANGIAFSAWQGYDADGTTVNNTVKEVTRFDTIVMHKVKWDTTTPALKSTNGFTSFGHGLDITDITFEGTPVGIITLLKSPNYDFNTLNLTYNNGTTTTTANLAKGSSESCRQIVKQETGVSSQENGVELTYNTTHEVSIADQTKVEYSVNCDVTDVTFGRMAWGTPRVATDKSYDYTHAKIDMSNLKFNNPESITAGGTTILLKANDRLRHIAATAQNVSYEIIPAKGVIVNGSVNGSYKTNVHHEIEYTATATHSPKLIFRNVEWKDSGALINHATDATKNIDFTGADVDTSNISFTNVKKLATNKQMTLVSDFGTAVGTISGTQFSIGPLKGEGHAFYENSNLRYLVTRGIDGTVDVSGKTKEITGGTTVMGDAIGAATVSGTAESNKVNVSGASKVQGNVVGAVTVSGLVNKNEANITGNSLITGNVDAAHTDSGSATANTVNVESSKVNGNAVGAVTDSGVAIGNVASVNGGRVGGDVAGATSNSGTVSNGNTAKVQSAEVGGNVYGGKSTSGEVNTSIVNVSGGTVKGSVYGGQTDGDKKADGNQVKLEQEAKVQKDVYGGYSQQGIATGNKVTVDGATVDGTVYGGKSKDKSDNNSVRLNGGTVGAIIGGGCEEASGNTVIITGGEVLNGVYGAKAGTSATNNTITMTGGKVNNVLYGGYTESMTGTAIGNIVNLYGMADVSNASVFGGNSSAIAGNTLNIGTMINSVKNIANFETMNYVAVPWSKEKAAVTISDGKASDLSTTKVSAAKVFFTDTTSLEAGDTMTLLDEQKVAVNERVQAGNITKESKYTAGSSLKGTGILSLDDSGNVVYKVIEKKAHEQTHNTVMGATASMVALSAGNDFVGAAVDGLSLSSNTGTDGVSTFAQLGGGSMRQETGSHVDSHTWNAILALGHQNVKKSGTTEYGAFFEYGTGNYSTFNGDIRGDGSMHYTGGGLLGKWTSPKKDYIEGSIRLGSIKDDASNVLTDNMGNAYGYNTSTGYYGFHVGYGKVFDYSGGRSLDVYGKFFYNHRNGVSFDAGGHYDLDAINSKILRVGARYSMRTSDQWKWYGGLAYEYEFGGEATGTVAGIAIRGASVKGGSLRAEIGATITQPDSPWTVDLNLTAFAGKKRGVSGGVGLKYNF